VIKARFTKVLATTANTQHACPFSVTASMIRWREHGSSTLPRPAAALIELLQSERAASLDKQPIVDEQFLA
jgi:hypothetical protein